MGLQGTNSTWTWLRNPKVDLDDLYNSCGLPFPKPTELASMNIKTETKTVTVKSLTVCGHTLQLEKHPDGHFELLGLYDDKGPVKVRASSREVLKGLYKLLGEEVVV